MPNSENLMEYYFLGKMIGKAIYERIIIQPVLSKVFLNKVLELNNSIEDLRNLDN
jgi:ubiquitin-protein ligase E3 C